MTTQTNAAIIDNKLAEDEIVAGNMKDLKEIEHDEKQVMPNAPHNKLMLEINDEVKEWFKKEERALKGIVKNAPEKVEEIASETFSNFKHWGSALGETISGTFNKILDWI